MCSLQDVLWQNPEGGFTTTADAALYMEAVALKVDEDDELPERLWERGVV